MKVLLDECMPPRLRSMLVNHEVYTVGYLHWKGTGDGTLLSLAKADKFDVVVTSDKAVETQQIWRVFRCR